MPEKWKRYAIGGFGLVVMGTAVLFAASRLPVLPSSSPSTDAQPQLAQSAPDASPSAIKRVRSTSSGKASVESKKGRAEYFFRMLRDPATNAIPPSYRSRELAYAKTLPSHDKVVMPSAGNSVGNQASNLRLTWQEVGPTDVGGRTRALALDVRNSNIILAGGVSGGVWKSIDGGQTWVLKTAMDVPLSVTWIAQDTRSGHQDTWYYTTGEFYRSTASDLGDRAHFFGSGVYKSTDNGETWQQLISSEVVGDTATYISFQYASKIVVHPGNGYVYVAVNGFGVYRSTNGGGNFELVLGGLGEHEWADVAISASPGGIYTLLATLSSSPGLVYRSGAPGFYVSTEDGAPGTWQRDTAVMPAFHQRTVIAPVPSRQEAYLYTYEEDRHWLSFAPREEVIAFTLVNFQDINNMTAHRRALYLPDIGGGGNVNTQRNYNMAMEVKPDDGDFVLFGATNLFRSTDGVTTPMNDADRHWVGGFSTDNTSTWYENQHPDQHVLVFDPHDSNVLWAGHDGGISRTHDVNAMPMVWESMNNGYNVTQFYTVAMSPSRGATEVLGGTQDNGTPFFDWCRPEDGARDISSGDGGYAYFGSRYIYSSSQYGLIWRVALDGDREAVILDCAEIGGCFFIHPFVVDPTGESIMYVPIFDSRELWRANNIERTPAPGWGDSSWERIASFRSGTISALAISESNPSHRLYFAGYGASIYSPPSLFRLDDADTAVDSEVDISIPNAPQGAWVHNIAVNPADADEILVVMSNYNIIGLYHSSDGGTTYTAVEGNLEGGAGNPGLGGYFNPGPSLRWGAIVPPVNAGGAPATKYYVATSIGVFSTTRLDGSNTTWMQEGGDVMGNVVVAALAARPSDATVVAATHGRGIFVAQGQAPNSPPQAHAGADQTVIEGSTVVLDGGLSNDPDGDPLTYQWTQIAGLPVSLQDSGDVIATFAAPSVDTDTVLSFGLVVNDGSADSEPDTVDITVMPTPNNLPQAHAGADQTVIEGSTVVLDGGLSNDPDGDPLTYQWTQIAGLPVSLQDSGDVIATFAAPSVDTDTVLSFGLVVNDGSADSEPDTVDITVMPTPNNPPQAHAGADQTVIEGSRVELDGSLSSDPDGDPLTYQWTQMAGLPVVRLKFAFNVNATFTAPLVDTSTVLSFGLVVNDGWADSEPDAVDITVMPTPNNPPQAHAGADQTVIEGSTVVLDGGLSNDPDGDPLTYQWTQIAGLPVSLQDSGDVIATFAAPSVDTDTVLSFGLVVNDGSADSEPGTVDIMVRQVDPPLPPPPSLPSGGGGCAVVPGSTSNDELLVLFIGVLAYLGLKRRGQAWSFGFRRQWCLGSWGRRSHPEAFLTAHGWRLAF